MLGLAYRFTVEMLAGIGVGGFVGWWMDKWFGTAPAFLLILLSRHDCRGRKFCPDGE